MNSSEPSFTDLMARVQKGSPDAVWEIIDRYGWQIQKVVRRHLNANLRSQFDSADFMQLVWVSFFRSPEIVHSFSSPADLAAFLMTLARNKVINETRKHRNTKAGGVRKVQSYDDPEIKRKLHADRSPTPSAVAVARERWQQLISNQPKHYQEVARLKLMGEAQVDIARKLKIDERTVRKIIGRLCASVSAAG
jgi:RNA polymerase sigma factor (sigma-70 family)